MKNNLHVVTGGTGFIGSALILELLQRTSARIVALIRPDARGAQRRLHETLSEVAALYGLAELDDAITSRCEAVAADLLEPGCGVSQRVDWSGAQLWHCAASLQFQDRHAEQIFATNVDGTKRVVALAELAGIDTINMISTAYVAGTRSGLILEEPVDEVSGEVEASANNHYERSKILAENAVLDAEVRRVRIMRPSIVIGHSRMRTALNFNGLYGFVRNTYKFRQLIERTQRQLASELEVRVVADPDATVNMIPVDIVAADAVGLALAEASGGVYHLSNPSPPPTRKAVEIVFEAVGLRPPTFVSDRGDFSALDRKFNSRVDFYTSYLTGAKEFCRAKTDHYVEDSRAADFALDEDELRRFCGWYVDKLEARGPRSVAR